MKNPNVVKIAFDLLMVILLVLIYSVSATGPLFHEVLGVSIFILFSIHLIYNRKWITLTGKKIADKSFAGKQKFMYISDILLFITFVLSGVSGILISKELFGFGYVSVWRYVHVCSATSSVILLSMHLGLHGDMIVHTVKDCIHVPKFIGRTLCLLLFCGILGLGIYGMRVSQTGRSDVEAHTKMITFLDLLHDAAGGNESREPDRKEDKTNPRDDGKGHGNLQPAKEDAGFNGVSMILTASSYLSVILLCSLITHLLEKKIFGNRVGGRHREDPPAGPHPPPT
jgi:hypothetical protein